MNQEKLSDLVVVNIEHKFTPAETALNGSELGRWLQEKDELENKLKVIKAEYKAKIEECNAKVKQYSGYINNGFRMKEENCELWVNYDLQKREYVSKNTGYPVKVEDMHASDFQKKINFEEEQRGLMAITEENNEAGRYAEEGPLDQLGQIIDEKASVYHTDEFEQQNNPNTDDDDLFEKSDD